MFKGLRRVFSKGHAVETETVEGDVPQPQFDEPVAVRPKSKSVATASPPPNEFACSSDEVGRNGGVSSNTVQQAAPCNGGKAAWNSNDMGDSSFSARHSTKANVTSILSSSPVAANLMPQSNKPPTGMSSHAPCPHASAAWGDPAPSPPEKDTLSRSVGEKDTPKRGSLFRSGSKNARSGSPADDSTEVEQFGSPRAQSGDTRTGGMPQRTSFDRRSAGAPNRHCQPKDGPFEGITFESVARGNGLRAGALVATPQAL